jgi:hypothetical protein
MLPENLRMDFAALITDYVPRRATSKLMMAMRASATSGWESDAHFH